MANGTLRVLAVQTVAAESHWNFMRGVLHALAVRGHAVTVYTPFIEGMITGCDNCVQVVDTSTKYDKNMTIVNVNDEVIMSFARRSAMLSLIANADHFA